MPETRKAYVRDLVVLNDCNIIAISWQVNECPFFENMRLSFIDTTFYSEYFSIILKAL